MSLRSRLSAIFKKQRRKKAVEDGILRDHGAGQKAQMKRKRKALNRRRDKLARVQRQRSKK